MEAFRYHSNHGLRKAFGFFFFFSCFGAGLGVILRIESNCRTEDGYEISNYASGQNLVWKPKGNWLKEANRDRDNLAEIVTLSGNGNCIRRNWTLARRGKAGNSEIERELCMYGY